jgi:hypothetical protein
MIATLPAVFVAVAVTLSGCKATDSTTASSNTDAEPAASSGHLGSSPSPSPSRSHSSSPSHSTSSSSAHSTSSTSKPSSKPAGPRIVSFRIKQKPKCAEGTAVFRADPVPLIIAWEIKGATSAALSVDDPTHTPGTYGPEGLTGTEEFFFSCAGGIGTTEKHTYAIYTVGGGTQRSATLTATAKILDHGKQAG